MGMKRTTRRAGRLLPAAMLAALLFLAAGCGGKAPEARLDDAALRQLVHDLSVGKVQAASASISSTELVVTDGKGERTVYGLPEDAFFVSIAPYYEHTHPCAIHSLTGCQGELPRTSFDLAVEDESGAMILKKTVVTPDNGFIDLWLERDKTFRVTISRDGHRAVQHISTFEGDPTCITTMRLH